ncbi:MAG: substrate-binding domain-containing protein [Rhizobiales bacterium]|nr:substrate-binding domain-containing protein [Hyphomicrobiales bacterium]
MCQRRGVIKSSNGEYFYRFLAGGTGALILALLPTLVPGVARAQQKITIDGSTGTAPLVEALGKAFKMKSNVAVEVGKGLGGKARLEALSAGKIDIAMASHGLKISEVTAAGMKVHRIAMTPVVFGVHESVKVDSLSSAQICVIYENKMRDWKEAGGTALAIVPLARPESEVDMEIARGGIGCFKSLKLADSVKLHARAGDMAKALTETAGGIGMTSATIVERSGGKIKAIALDGVVANDAAVLAGRYRLTRDAFLITRDAASADVKAFIDFVKSPDGAAVIRANGAIATTK